MKNIIIVFISIILLVVLCYVAYYTYTNIIQSPNVIQNTPPANPVKPLTPSPTPPNHTITPSNNSLGSNNATNNKNISLTSSGNTNSSNSTSKNLPKTALISDYADKVLEGIAIFVFGFVLIKTNIIGKLIFKTNYLKFNSLNPNSNNLELEDLNRNATKKLIELSN